jgi:hypothetical protein
MREDTAPAFSRGSVPQLVLSFFENEPLDGVVKANKSP